MGYGPTWPRSWAGKANLAEQHVGWAKRSVPTITSEVFDGGHGAGAPLPYLTRSFRCQLPRRRRRVGEIGSQLRVAGLGVLHCLLFDRAVAADAVGQRENFDGGI